MLTTGGGVMRFDGVIMRFDGVIILASSLTASHFWEFEPRLFLNVHLLIHERTILFEAPLLFKPHSALGQMFEVADPPNATLH